MDAHIFKQTARLGLFTIDAALYGSCAGKSWADTVEITSTAADDY